MKNVLIVEDDPMVALINKSYVNLIKGLNYLGCVTEEEKIIDVLDKEHVDLIILDVYLPKKSGLDILKSLRAKGYIVDIIMVTAANSRNEIKTAFAYGAIDYLVKPFEFDRFSEAIKKYMSIEEVLAKSDEFKQKEIDNISCLENQEKLHLPKGLQKRTLEKIAKVLEGKECKTWTIREISCETDISNVTVKKYMDYLENINRVKVTPVYGNVGRPEYNYIYKK
ncbi:response regulator [Clostridium sp. Marseille-Q2269]|uniref:response regulator n=1 Tax=Clostridium sp. Marseille-Q2269 TaxID=2942205 RepID=UPI0020745A35|nr:response regulator [Clostridium sp. Marseille-Q2269]